MVDYEPRMVHIIPVVLLGVITGLISLSAQQKGFRIYNPLVYTTTQLRNLLISISRAPGLKHAPRVVSFG